MFRTNIYLEERQTQALDQIASNEQISRAELIRRLLDQGIAAQTDDLVADLEVIKQSAGALAHDGFDLPVRATGDREAWLEEVWRR